MSDVFLNKRVNMKLRHLIITLLMTTIVAGHAASQVAPPPPPMEGQPNSVQNLKNHYQAFETSKGDFIASIEALISERDSLSSENARLKTENAKLKSAPGPSTTSAPAPKEGSQP